MQAMLKAWEAELVGLHGRLGGLFQRSEPRRRSLAYMKGLLGSAQRRNGWQLAEWMGESTPDGVQHLLERAAWDADAKVLAAAQAEEDKRRTVAQQLDIWRSSLIVAPSSAEGYGTAVRFWKKAPVAAPLEGQAWQDMPLIGEVPIDAQGTIHIHEVMVRGKSKATTKTNKN